MREAMAVLELQKWCQIEESSAQSRLLFWADTYSEPCGSQTLNSRAIGGICAWVSVLCSLACTAAHCTQMSGL